MKIHEWTGRVVHLPGDDIDTDRLVPARFLKVLSFDDLKDALLVDERYQRGFWLEHPLNAPGADQATVLVTGANFGCGSSRAHAPQALRRWGFRVILAESFAEIFATNALALGMVCATAPAEVLHRLSRAAEIRVDVNARCAWADGQPFPVRIPQAPALLSGRWDPLGELLAAADQVEVVRQRRYPGPVTSANRGLVQAR